MAKILLAEDNLSMCQFLCMSLQKAGHFVTPCTNGEDALKILEYDNDYELLLADIAMQDIDGISLAKRATSINEDIEVMFITGFAAMSLKSGLFDRSQQRSVAQTAQLLSRPFHLNRLVENVDMLLAA